VGIAGLGDAGATDLRNNGIDDENRLSVLKHLRKSIPDAAGRIDCNSALAAYLADREGLLETPTG
jgi:hypothetical protein